MIIFNMLLMIVGIIFYTIGWYPAGLSVNIIQLCVLGYAWITGSEG